MDAPVLHGLRTFRRHLRCQLAHEKFDRKKSEWTTLSVHHSIAIMLTRQMQSY